MADQFSELSKRFVTIIENKVRNLEKRKSKLDDLNNKEKKGLSLNVDQKVAISHFPEVIAMLECVHDLQKSFSHILSDINKNSKKLLKKTKQQTQEDCYSHTKQFLRIYTILSKLNSINYKEDLLSGSNGAPTLSSEEVDEIEFLNNSLFSGENNSTLDKVDEISTHINAIVSLKSKVLKNKSYAEVKEIIDKITASNYLYPFSKENHHTPSEDEEGKEEVHVGIEPSRVQCEKECEKDELGEESLNDGAYYKCQHVLVENDECDEDAPTDQKDEQHSAAKYHINDYQTESQENGNDKNAYSSGDVSSHPHQANSLHLTQEDHLQTNSASGHFNSPGNYSAASRMNIDMHQRQQQEAPMMSFQHHHPGGYSIRSSMHPPVHNTTPYRAPNMMMMMDNGINNRRPVTSYDTVNRSNNGGVNCGNVSMQQQQASLHQRGLNDLISSFQSNINFMPSSAGGGAGNNDGGAMSSATRSSIPSSYIQLS